MNRLISFLTRARTPLGAVTAVWISSATVVAVTCDNDNADEASPIPLLDPNDPYQNLPDKDEPTTCTICMINRQGPCRFDWRMFEHCMKDHGSHRDGESPVAGAASLGEACDKYMLPWLTCVQTHRMLYQLYTNQVYQREYIDWMEQEQYKEALSNPRQWQVKDVDFSAFLEYLSSRKVTMERLESSNRLKHGDFPVWYGKQRAVDAVVEITVNNVPMMHDGLPIEIAYAKDEHGHILGFEQFGAAKEDAKETDTLTLYLRVGHSFEITLYRIYKEEEAEKQGEETTTALALVEPVVFQSQTINLLDVARADNGIPEKQE